MADRNQFHLSWFDKCDPHWPRGGWSVYQIDGDQIADKVVRAGLVIPKWGPAYYQGEVIARHSWSGFIGIFETLPEVRAAIEKAHAESLAQAAIQAKRKGVE